MKKRRPSRARVVGYRYGFDSELRFDESAALRIMTAAQRDGVVSDYDTGRGLCLWFNGPPGPKLRAVRRQIETLLKGRTI